MKWQSGEVNIHLILTIFLGIGMVIFGILAVLAYQDNNNIHATLDSRTQAAAKAAADKQKAVDKEDNRKANELPYRTYTALPVDGSFTLQIPKNWSIYAQHASSGTQLDLMANPDVVNFITAGVSTQAFELKLIDTPLQSVAKSYEDLIKAKKLTSTGITVSGISATRFEGQIDAQRHNGAVIIFAVRDKTMVMKTEDANYKNEFNTIVASAHITP